MNLQLPPDVAMQKKMQAMQQNQLYTLAFQIYAQLLSADQGKSTFEYLADRSIIAAQVFSERVAEHMKKEVK